MDSVYSDDKLEPVRSDCESESDDQSPSKEVFKNIRTRYLSRVHSVTDPLIIDSSVVDQAFYKNKGTSESLTDLKESIKEEFTIEIDNVTTDETNDDASQRTSSEEFPNKVLAEVILSPFEHKELKRQNAIDLIDDIDLTAKISETEIDLNSNFRLVKSDSNYDPDIEEDCAFKRSFSGTYNGKPKAYSLDNLNTNEDYKTALNEATSIDFLDRGTESKLSLFTEGSDSVFLSPVEKNNNYIDKVDDINNKNVKRVLPVVKAEALLPFPYPDDIKKAPVHDLLQPPKRKLPEDITIDVTAETEFKKANDDLKLTFKAAIERIMGHNKLRRTTSLPTSIKVTDLQSYPDPELITVDETDKTISQTGKTTDEIDKSVDEQSYPDPDLVTVDEADNTNIINEIPTVKVTDTETEPKDAIITKENNEESTTSKNIENAETDNKNQSIDIIKTVSTEPQPEQIDDNVSYHLKINTPDLDDNGNNNIAKIVTTQSNPNLILNNTTTTFQTFLAPISIANITPSSPVIISPVLIQPVFFKSVTMHGQPIQQVQDPKKGTVYYSDIDQVANENHENRDQEDRIAKRRGMFQKNAKAKQLPYLTWNTFGSNDNLNEIKAPSPSNNIKQLELNKPLHSSPKPTKNPSLPVVDIVQKSQVKPSESTRTVGKLSKTPLKLMDNQYYQPMQNVPFVINTSQTFKPETEQTKEDISLNRRYSEQENVYEEIGPVITEVITKDNNKNIADDEKISNRTQSCSDEFELTREELLKVPRRVKKPKTNDRFTKSKSVDFLDSPNAAKEMASITKSIISLSRAPSAKDLPKNPTGSIVEIVQSLEKKTPASDLRKKVATRKLSLQHPNSPSIDPNVTNTGSLPRDKPYWRTLEHKRLSHPLRSLNDPPPRRPLRKSALL